MTIGAYKKCPSCAIVSHIDRWEICDLPHEEIQCPECRAVVAAGGFDAVAPERPQSQLCLFCGGEGVV